MSDQVAKLEIYYDTRVKDENNWAIFVSLYYSRQGFALTKLDEGTAVDLFDSMVKEILKKIDTDDSESFMDSISSALPSVAKKYGLK